VLRIVFLLLGVGDFFLIRWIRDLLLQGSGEVQTTSAPTRRLLVANMISMSLCEIPALLGFVLYLMAARPLDFYPLVVLSLILVSYYFPRIEAWEEWLREQGE